MSAAALTVRPTWHKLRERLTQGGAIIATPLILITPLIFWTLHSRGFGFALIGIVAPFVVAVIARLSFFRRHVVYLLGEDIVQRNLLGRVRTVHVGDVTKVLEVRVRSPRSPRVQPASRLVLLDHTGRTLLRFDMLLCCVLEVGSGQRVEVPSG